MTGAEPGADAGRAPSIRQLAPLAAPLLVVGLSALAWFVSDRLLYVGPFDRATIGWAVVVPLWAAAPYVAAVGWQRSSARVRTVAATVCGLAVGAPIAGLLWLAMSPEGCQFGPARAPVEWVVPAAIIGTVVGVGFGANSLLAAGELRRGHRWSALLLGAAIQVAIVVAAALLASPLFLGLCERP